jgi:hypothetical protein
LPAQFGHFAFRRFLFATSRRQNPDYCVPEKLPDHEMKSSIVEKNTLV